MAKGLHNITVPRGTGSRNKKARFGSLKQPPINTILPRQTIPWIPPPLIIHTNSYFFNQILRHANLIVVHQNTYKSQFDDTSFYPILIKLHEQHNNVLHAVYFIYKLFIALSGVTKLPISDFALEVCNLIFQIFIYSNNKYL